MPHTLPRYGNYLGLGYNTALPWCWYAQSHESQHLYAIVCARDVLPNTRKLTDADADAGSKFHSESFDAKEEFGQMTESYPTQLGIRTDSYVAQR